jgi:hypothetical protein
MLFVSFVIGQPCRCGLNVKSFISFLDDRDGLYVLNVLCRVHIIRVCVE